LSPSKIAWEERENGFVLSGRLTPEKNIETAIEIIRSIRQKLQDVHLHIVSSGYDLKYRKKDFRLRDQNEQWLFLQENIR
jgi:glycosyltransferase involved in cell wall biosynthesis